MELTFFFRFLYKKKTYSRFPFDELLVLFSLNGAPVILSIKFLAAACLASFLDFPAPMAMRNCF